MKFALLLVLFGSAAWSNNTPNVSDNFFNRLMDDSIIIHENGLVQGAKARKKFVSSFLKASGPIDTYEQQFTIDVNSGLTYEIGEIRGQSGSFSVMFLKRKDQGSKIELLVIYEKSDAENPIDQLDKSRDQWMALCNAHKAEQLVSELYTSDAFYYNRGRLLRGTSAISQEYTYMNDPAYKLKLTPKHIVTVTAEIAFEIGRCSGSYPLPYMLLWQKQDDGEWKVLMDSNF